MLIRLAALGALGYFGYRYLANSAAPANRSTGDEPALDPVAGGPLSSQATLQHSPDLPG